MAPERWTLEGSGGSGALPTGYALLWLSLFSSKQDSLELGDSGVLQRAASDNTLQHGSARASPHNSVLGQGAHHTGGRRGSSSLRRITAHKMLPGGASDAEARDANEWGGRLAAENALCRDLGTFNQIGVCIGVCTYMYLFTGGAAYGSFLNGGSGSLLYGFVFASVGSTIASASLAELTSACPTCSGLYFYTARLAPKAYMAYLSFFTGWLNILGATASLMLTAQVCANMVVSFRHLVTLRPVLQVGTAVGPLQLTSSVYQWAGGYTSTTQYPMLGYYWLIVAVCGLINLAPIQISAWFTSLAAYTALLFGPIMAVTMLCVAPTHQPASYVFKTFVVTPEVTGVSNPGAAFMLGTATSVGMLYGYDSCLYLVEESINSTVSAPRGIFWGLVITSLLGTATIIGFMFAVQDPAALFNGSTVTGGSQWGAQALWDVWAARYNGDGRGSLGFVCMIFITQVLSLLMYMLGTARKVYAMARDQLLPFSSRFASVNARGVPVNAMLLVVAFLMAMGPLMLVQQNQATFDRAVAYVALVTYSSYMVPITTRLLSSVHITPGPFDLGRWRTAVNLAAAAFFTIAHVIMAMPQYYPITWANMNYAGPSWALVLVLLHVWWVLPRPWGARHWARGPVAGVLAGVEYRL